MLLFQMFVPPVDTQYMYTVQSFTICPTEKGLELIPASLLYPNTGRDTFKQIIAINHKCCYHHVRVNVTNRRSIDPVTFCPGDV